MVFYAMDPGNYLSMSHDLLSHLYSMLSYCLSCLLNPLTLLSPTLLSLPLLLTISLVLLTPKPSPPLSLPLVLTLALSYPPIHLALAHLPVPQPLLTVLTFIVYLCDLVPGTGLAVLAVFVYGGETGWRSVGVLM